jgi:hypothetical protein
MRQYEYLRKENQLWGVFCGSYPSSGYQPHPGHFTVLLLRFNKSAILPAILNLADLPATPPIENRRLP